MLTSKWIRLVCLLEFIPCRSVLSVVKISPEQSEELTSDSRFSTTDSTEGHGKWGYGNLGRIGDESPVVQPVLTWKWIRLVCRIASRAAGVDMAVD